MASPWTRARASPPASSASRARLAGAVARRGRPEPDLVREPSACGTGHGRAAGARPGLARRHRRGRRDYLRPTLKALFPDPVQLPRTWTRRREVLIDALRARSQVIGVRRLRRGRRLQRRPAGPLVPRHGPELPIYVPDRLTEGYGPSPAAFRHLREAGRRAGGHRRLRRGGLRRAQRRRPRSAWRWW